MDNGSLSMRGFFGSRGVVRLGVIETIRGNSGGGSTRNGIGSNRKPGQQSATPHERRHSDRPRQMPVRTMESIRKAPQQPKTQKRTKL